ncbi:MAG: hypothetical protein IPL49_15410 [Saprospirales bacterium]|nr:hypothetical protein [Saprospirales bacterium]
MNSSNAVTRCLDSLQVLWEEYRNEKQSRICRWLVDQDAYSLIDAFYQTNADESSDSTEIFLRFESPFLSSVQYGKALSDELSSFVEEDREALAEEGIEIPWTSVYQETPDNTALGFLRNFFHFVLSLEMDEDELVVAFIAPVTIDDRAGWKKWWTDVLSLQLPPQIRLMICEVSEDNVLEPLAVKYSSVMTTIKPEIDGPGIMRQLMNEYGDQDDGCTHFRKAFFELTQEVGRRDAGSIRQAAKKALDLARQTGFPHLEITVLCTAGNGLASAGQLEMGLKSYEEARRIAKAAAPMPIIKEMPELEVELPGGNLFDQLGIQALFFKGAALVGAGQFDRAHDAYLEAVHELKTILKGKSNDQKVDWSNGGILIFHLLEALRMCGYCQENLGRKQEAVPFYEETLCISERLDPESRKSTTLGYSGRSLLEIYKADGQKNGYLSTKEKMNSLLGKGWEETLPQRAA